MLHFVLLILAAIAYSVQWSDCEEASGRRLQESDLFGNTGDEVCESWSTKLTPPDFKDLRVSADESQLPKFQGKFASSNVQCPIQDFEFLDGSSNFELSVLADEITVTLKEAAATVPGYYTFAIKAIAFGGAVEWVSASVIVTQANCKGLLLDLAKKQFKFQLPKAGQETVKIFESSSNYLKSIAECEQTFSLESVDQKLNPVLQIDQSGGVSFTNGALDKGSYKFSIKIETSRPNSRIDTVVFDDLTIELVCGPESTDVTPPILEARSATTDSSSVPRTVEKFFSSNIQCPIQSYKLVAGSQDFDLRTSGDDFILGLQAAQSLTVGSYQFTLKATAEGGAEQFVSQTFEITPGCIGIVKDVVKTFSFDVLTSGSETQKIFSSGTDYAGSNQACIQTYSLLEDQTSLFVMDEATGQLDVKIGTVPGDYKVTVVVETSRTIQTLEPSPIDRQLVPLEVKLQCGAASTVLVAPVLQDVTVTQDASSPAVFTDAFTSSNSYCKITSYELVTGSESFSLTYTDNQFTVTSKASSNVRKAGFSLKAVASGGATAYTSADVIVSQFAPTCFASLNQQVDKSKKFLLPASGSTVKTIFASGQEYISKSEPACLQTFRIVPPTNDLMLSSQGKLTVLLGSFKGRYDFSIEVTTEAVKGQQDDVRLIEGFQVEIGCGPTSAIISQPLLKVQDAIAGELPQLKAQFVSSNTKCPIETYQLVFGENNFSLKQQADQFTIELLEKYSKIEGTYSYSISAQAEGGAVATASSSMIIQQAPCNIVFSDQKDIKLFLPSNGEELQKVFFTGSEIASAQGCTQSYSLMMTDGSNVPTELIFENTGSLSVLVSTKKLYKFVISVKSSTSKGKQIQKSQQFSIETICGPQSTTVNFAKSLKTKKSADLPGPVSVIDVGSSSNSQCPIAAYYLVTGEEFHLFQSIQRESRFVVNLKQQFESVAGSYDFTIKAVAEGGAQKYTDGSVEIMQPCLGTLLATGSPKQFVLTPSEQTYVIFQSYQVFVMKNYDDCIQTFEVVRTEKQTNLQIDATGKLSATIGKQKGNFEFNIKITTFRSGSKMFDEKLLTSSFQIICGPESTSIYVPSLDKLFHDERSLLPPSVQAGFYSQNILCPITGYEIASGSDNFEFDGSPSDFKLTLKQSNAKVVGVYPFSIKVTAEGGSSAVLSSSIEITAKIKAIQLSGVTLQAYNFGDPNVPLSQTRQSTNEYVSSIKVCGSKLIQGLSFTLTNVDDQSEVVESYGFAGLCEQSLTLEPGDCITALGIDFDTNGQVTSLNYKRLLSDKVGSLGFSPKISTLSDFSGSCLTGYQLGFGARARNLQASQQALKRLVAVVNPTITQKVRALTLSTACPLMDQRIAMFLALHSIYLVACLLGVYLPLPSLLKMPLSISWLLLALLATSATGETCQGKCMLLTIEQAVFFGLALSHYLSEADEFTKLQGALAVASLLMATTAQCQKCEGGSVAPIVLLAYHAIMTLWGYAGGFGKQMTCDERNGGSSPLIIVKNYCMPVVSLVVSGLVLGLLFEKYDKNSINQIGFLWSMADIVLLLMFYPALYLSEPVQEQALVALCELDDLLRAAHLDQPIDASSIEVSSKELAQLAVYIEDISPKAEVEVVVPAIEPVVQKEKRPTRELHREMEIQEVELMPEVQLSSVAETSLQLPMETGMATFGRKPETIAVASISPRGRSGKSGLSKSPRRLRHPSLQKTVQYCVNEETPPLIEQDSENSLDQSIQRILSESVFPGSGPEESMEALVTQTKKGRIQLDKNFVMTSHNLLSSTSKMEVGQRSIDTQNVPETSAELQKDINRVIFKREYDGMELELQKTQREIVKKHARKKARNLLNVTSPINPSGSSSKSEIHWEFEGGRSDRPRTLLEALGKLQITEPFMGVLRPPPVKLAQVQLASMTMVLLKASAAISYMVQFGVSVGSNSIELQLLRLGALIITSEVLCELYRGFIANWEVILNLAADFLVMIAIALLAISLDESFWIDWHSEVLLFLGALALLSVRERTLKEKASHICDPVWQCAWLLPTAVVSIYSE